MKVIPKALTGEQLIQFLEDLLELESQGKLPAIAFRVYRQDGSFEDVVCGGTEEEHAQALQELQAVFAMAH